jgi:Fe-S oxidoreductase
MVTGEEIMSTRGRANAIRAALQGDGFNGVEPWRGPELEAALGSCLSCRACTAECPSNVNMALLKAELLHARRQRDGIAWRERIFGYVDVLGKFGSLAPQFANELLDEPWLRRVLLKTAGLTTKRPLLRFAPERFDDWFRRRERTGAATRGPVILWDDTFVRYHEPWIGRAAVSVLETAGFQVHMTNGRKCCGRPAFSQGDLDRAARLGRHNLALLRGEGISTPILFLEPSCWSMFVEDYREMKLPGAEAVAKRCFLFEQFMDESLSREPSALTFRPRIGNVGIHVHCHAKSLVNPGFMARLLQRIPEQRASVLETGCCGMAGAFGALESKYELSLKIGTLLVRTLERQPAETVVVASGTSCRQQIEHLTSLRPKHAAEVLAEAMIRSPSQ